MTEIPCLTTKRLRREKALPCPHCGEPLVNAERWFGGQRLYRCRCGQKVITEEVISGKPMVHPG